MRKKILLIASIVIVLGLAIAAVAYNQASSVQSKATMECCCKGDSCPMMKTREHSEKTMECCCKSGDSCPMKKDAATAEEKTCDCDCCAKA